VLEALVEQQIQQLEIADRIQYLAPLHLLVVGVVERMTVTTDRMAGLVVAQVTRVQMLEMETPHLLLHLKETMVALE